MQSCNKKKENEIDAVCCAQRNRPERPGMLPAASSNKTKVEASKDRKEIISPIPARAWLIVEGGVYGGRFR